MTRSAAPRRRSLLLLLALLVAAAGALELGWLAAFSWASRSGRLESWLNRRPERVSVSFERARSRWPGLLEVEGLRLRGRTQRIDWELTAERVRGQLALVPLIARTARFHAVRGEGLVLRTRRRVSAPTKGSPAVMSPMPLPGAERARRPRTGPPNPRWTMSFRKLYLERIREIHLDTTRFTGEARGEGGFAIDAASATAEIFASRLEIERGEIEHAGAPLGRALAGRIELAVAPWPYRELRDRRLLPHLTGRILLDGELDDRALLAELLRRAPWARLEPALAPVEIDLRLRAGRLLPGSRLASPPVRRRLRLLDYVVEGPAGLLLEVGEAAAGGIEARWAARFDAFILGLEAGGDPLLTGKGLALTGRAPDPVLAELAERTELGLELGEAVLPDLARFSGWLPRSSGLELAGGSARVSGQLAVRLADRRPSGQLAADFERAKLRWSGAALEGRIEVEVPVAGGDLEQRRLDVSGAKLRLSGFAAPALDAAGGPPAEGWWANVHLPRAAVRLAPPVEIDADFEARLRDTVPIVGLFELKRDLPSWAERTLSVENVDLRGRLRGRPRAFALEGLESPLYGGVLTAWASFDEERRRGKALLAWRRLAVGVGFDGEERELRVVHAREWFDEREPAKAGSR